MVMQGDNQTDQHLGSHQSAPTGDLEMHQVDSRGPNQSAIHIAADTQDDAIVTWEASEFVHHAKANNWYVFVGLFGVALAAVLFFLVDWFSSLVIVLLTVAVFVWGKQEPRVLRYSISESGISVGEKNYLFENFSSFSLNQQTQFSSIEFMPTKKFSTPITIYLSNDNLEQVLEIVGTLLPRQDRAPDPLDKLTSWLRF